ncbi:MAG TPA: CBS domain-containing protein [Cyclobacteriaceae bacterium]|nr:CBS domain-containing protein [Cyclobacteriaceae bacterium]
MIPPLKPTDKVELGLTWMEELRTNILPVLEDGQFKGLITDEMLYDLNNPAIPVGEVALDTAGCYVFSEKHIYDVLKVSSEYRLAMVAVLDREYAYQGVVTIADAIAAFADTISIQTEGGVLILSMPMTEYSLYDIARIIESENAKILSSFINSDPLDENKIKVTLKVDQPELRHIRATLERFGYKVINHYQEEVGVSREQDRLGNLLRFLDI